MKRVILVLTTLCTLLCLPFALANPIIPEYISEFFFTKGHWTLETGTRVPSGNLDGWKLSSRTGTSAFKTGISIGRTYVLLTTDSLLSPLFIDPTGDSISMSRTSGEHYGLVFGNAPDSHVQAPAPGWSIAFNQFFYLDRSPTPGAANDFVGGMATISGTVRDSITHAPISHAMIQEEPGDWMQYWYTSDSGTFSVPVHAHNLRLYVGAAAYTAAFVRFSLIPDQVADTVIFLSALTSVERSGQPLEALLLEGYPNPFNPRTTIAYALPAGGKVTLRVYDTLGKEVAELVRGPRQAAQYHVAWNGTDDDGTAVASGVYLVRLQLNETGAAAPRVKTLKILLVR
jgi:hypothetical protein